MYKFYRLLIFFAGGVGFSKFIKFFKILILMCESAEFLYFLFFQGKTNRWQNWRRRNYSIFIFLWFHRNSYSVAACRAWRE